MNLRRLFSKNSPHKIILSGIEEPEVSDNAQKSPWSTAVEVALIVLVFFVHVPGGPPEPNEPDYLGKARHYWNPDWAAGDIFLESADTHWVFYSLFGWVTLFVSLETAAWIGRLAMWIFLAWSWQRLSNSLVPGRGISVLTAVLYVALNERFHLAGEWVVEGVEAKGFAYACVFLAVASLVRDHWNRAFVWTGFATAIHPLVGLWGGVCLAVSWVLAGRGRPEVSSLIPGIACGGLLAAVGVVPALTMDMNVDAATRATAHAVYVYRRLRHHLLPEAFATFFVIRHLLLLAVWIAIAWWTPQREAWRRFRGFVWGAIFIAACGLGVDLITRFDHDLRASLLRYYWFRSTDAILPLGVALGVLPAVRALTRYQPTLRHAMIAGLCLAAIIHLLEYGGTWRLQHRTPRGEQAYNVSDWLDVCQWVEQHTPQNAVFITPRYNQTFKWHTGRAEVATWKDLPQDAAGIVEWEARLSKLRLPREERFTHFGQETLAWLGAERLRNLGNEYQATYLVTVSSDRLDLPATYRNATYAVYKLRDSVPAD